jgi:glycosyltransferase involved in cell wall biosynthesis
MADTPTASVVIPTYNRSAELVLCLEALAAQTRRDFEVLVVDDGSVDDTSLRVERFANAHPELELRYLCNEQNVGANRSRNRAVAHARGELVAFLDSDCRPQPAWLEELVAAFDSPRVVAASGRVETPPPTNVYELAMSNHSLIADTREAARLVAGNLAVRRSVLVELPFDEDLKWGCDEEGLHLRLAAAGHLQRSAPAAIVVHHHPFERRSFYRYAWRAGLATAWFVYKYRLPPRPDVLPFLLAWLSLPLGAAGVEWLLIPFGLFALGTLALLYVLAARKRLGPVAALRCLPVYLAYYQVRAAAYLKESVRLHLGTHDIRRVELSRSG